MEKWYGKETGYQAVKGFCHGMKFDRDGAASEEGE